MMIKIAKIACICEQAKLKENCDFSVLTGSSSFMLDAMRVGAVGTISVLACVLGEPIIDLYNMALQESAYRHRIDFDEVAHAKFGDRAQELQNRLIGPDLAVIIIIKIIPFITNQSKFPIFLGY
jgi:hypothetical protein